MVRTFLTLGVLVLAAEATAAERHVKSRRADFHLPSLVQLAEMGEVALIESTPEGRCRQIVLFSVLNAPPTKVWEVLMDVPSYPKFLKTVVQAKVIKRAKSQLLFDWEVDIPFFNLKGRRRQRGRRPYLVEVQGVRGDLRGSKERWELFSIPGSQRTLAVFYRSLDTETGGLLLKSMLQMESSMEHGATLATGFVHMRQLRRHVGSLPRPSYRAQSGDVPPFTSLRLDRKGVNLTHLGKLLRHGHLALIESYNSGALKQVAILGHVKANKKKMAAIVQDPARYPEFIPNFAEQIVTRIAPNRLKMEWELEVPMVNMNGISMMTIEPTGAVDVVAVDGDIQRGRWRWEFNERPDGTVIPIHYAYTDVRESSWVTRLLIERQPLFEHGIVIASGAVAMNAMKARAEGRR